MTIKVIEGSYIPSKDYKIVIIAARFNDFFVSKLVEGAVDTLKRHNINEEQISIIKIPGAFEIPLIAQNIALKKDIDGIIALGAVIRGSTPHFDFVANECTKGLTQVSLQYNKPIGFGVLTVDSLEQAIERSGTKSGNKGSEAAMTVLETLNVLNNISICE